MRSTASDLRAGTGPEDVSRGELLRAVAGALRSTRQRLYVLHGYEDYPYRVGSDLDCVSDEPARIPRLLHERGVNAVVQAIEHEKDAHYYVLCRRNKGGPVFVALDVSADYRRNGRVLLDGAEISGSRRPAGDFDVPAPDLEFAYYAAKKILKGRLEERHAERLSGLYAQDPAGCRRRLESLLPEREGRMIVRAAQSGDWEHVRARIGELRKALLRGTARRDPVGVARYWIGDLSRRIGRLLRPTGLAVAFLGPDGSGKSTVMDRVERDLAPAFRRSAQYRLRPAITKEGPSSPVTEPHALPPRGLAPSLLKLALWCADYTLGYALRIYPKLVCSSLVMFDRYYWDLLVDPARYRYGGPLRLASAVGPLLARPDLTIVLDAPVEVLLARKQELGPEELRRQRLAYGELARQLPGGHVVDASRSIEEVASDVEEIILDHMARRTARRLGVDRSKR